MSNNLMTSEVESGEKKRRRRRENGDTKAQIKVVSSLGEGKLVDRFQSAISEKKDRKNKREKSEKQRQIQKEKRDREVSKFKAEINALLEDEEPTLKPSEKMATFVPKMKGTVKGKFEELERKKREEEKKKAENERRRRKEKDMRDRKMVEIEIAKKEIEEKQRRPPEDENSNTIVTRKERKNPEKLNASDFEELVRRREEEERNKVEHERKMKMEAERRTFRELSAQKSQVSDGENSEVRSTKKLARKPSRLSASFTKFDLMEKERIERERQNIRNKSKQLLEEELKIVEESKKNLTGHEENGNCEEEEEISSNNSESSNSSSNAQSFSDSSGDENLVAGPRERKKKKLTKRGAKPRSEEEKPSKLDASKLRFDVLERQRAEKERWKMQNERRKHLEEEKRVFEEAKKRRILNQDEIKDESAEQMKEEPNKLEYTKTQFDVISQHKMEEERLRIREEKSRLLKEEKRLFEEEREKMENGTDKEQKVLCESCPPTSPNKLSSSLINFEQTEEERLERERTEAQEKKMKKMEEELQAFQEERRRMNNDADEDQESGEEDGPNSQTSPNKLSSLLINFEQVEEKRMERERRQAQQKKLREMEEELKIFQEEKEKMNDSDKEETPSPPTSQVRQPRPKRLSTSFTRFDEIARMKQEEERRRIREEKMRELEEERRTFKDTRDAEEQTDSDTDYQREATHHRPINKMNVQQQMEAVLRAQREAEEKRIMETKFGRMTIEQQEMYLAKERQLHLLQEKLARAEAESDSCSSDEYSDETNSEDYTSGEDDENSSLQHFLSGPSSERDDISTPGSNDSGYTGAPWFIQTLSNMSLTEGKPVRFDAIIHADPHPKVTWFFNDRLIPDSPDFKTINKGTQYSLYMNESFVDDSGEYMCRAENTRGTATSKAVLTVVESAD